MRAVSHNACADFDMRASNAGAANDVRAWIDAILFGLGFVLGIPWLVSVSHWQVNTPDLTRCDLFLGKMLRQAMAPFSIKLAHACYACYALDCFCPHAQSASIYGHNQTCHLNNWAALLLTAYEWSLFLCSY